MIIKHTIAFLAVLIFSSALLYGMVALVAWDLGMDKWHWVARLLYAIPQGLIIYRLTLYYLESINKK